jgi:multiple sugar transport system permease protein
MTPSYRWALAFLAPTILGLLIFRLVPMVWAFGLSFSHWKIFDDVRFAGLANYVDILTQPHYQKVFANTALFALMYVPGVVALALLLAVLLNRAVWGAGLFRGLYFLPYITTTVAVALTWRWMFSTRFGLINNALDWVGISANPAWLGDPAFALPALALVAIWRDAGFYMLLLLAGLQTIDTEYYKAAKLDGASPLMQFWTITVPLLSRSLFFVLIIALIRSTQTFELTFGLTEGGPNGATVTLGFQIYLDAFVNFEMGMASALAYTLALILGLLTLVSFRLRQRWTYD